MKYSGKVMIEKVTEKTGVTSVRNPHHVDNVNVAQGPRTGNSNPGGKRARFMDGKDERSSLADSVNRAYADRSPTTRSHTKITIDPTLEGVASDVKPKKFSR